MIRNRKIKVLFRHRSMEIGGVEKVLLSMLNNLDREKFDVSLVLNLFQGELRNEIPPHIQFKTLAKGKEDLPKNKLLHNVALIIRAMKLLMYRKFPLLAYQYIIPNDADVEIATGYTMFSDVLNSANKTSKKIGWFHSDITFTKLQPGVAKILKQIPQFDYFIFGSQQTKDILVATYPKLKLPENKVILNAIPVAELKNNAEAFSPVFTKKTFVSVGRLHSRKGYHKLMEAHAQLLNDGFDHEIIVIGDGEERENLKNQAEKLGVIATFKFLGSLLNPYPYVKNADFYIMSSESEGWPLIIAESLILQKPIIATDVGGIGEMITHRENGILIKYDVGEMYRAIKEFLTNKNLVETLKENLKNSEAQFDSQKIFTAVEEIILNLAKK